ncbi:MAG: adenylate/guanylate cyclase domain-containing protein [Bacteroidota bacterium]
MRLKRKEGILLYWIISWVILANLFILFRFGGINWSEDIFILTQKEWIVLFGQATFVGLLSGILFGILDTNFRDNRYFRYRGFGSLVLTKTITHFLIAVVILFFGFFLAALFNGYGIEGSFQRSLDFYSSFYFLVVLVYLLSSIMLLNFILQVNDKFGPGNLWKLFFGRYYSPLEETRIFSFIDLRSSTKYAEILGHIKYSRLIQDCFVDITPIIEQYEAEIYQYVGDEVVLTWRADRPDNYTNAVKAFYGFQNRISEKVSYYLDKYGLVPEFKAGMHVGLVIIAEVGIIKKEIAYHGDAINTASRIQDECNRFGKLLLCSGVFRSKLHKVDDLDFSLIGKTQLKGKTNPIDIYSVENKKSALTSERRLFKKVNSDIVSL